MFARGKIKIKWGCTPEPVGLFHHPISSNDVWITGHQSFCQFINISSIISKSFICIHYITVILIQFHISVPDLHFSFLYYHLPGLCCAETVQVSSFIHFIRSLSYSFFLSFSSFIEFNSILSCILSFYLSRSMNRLIYASWDSTLHC